MKFPDYCIVQFTKAPGSRPVKTRMASVLDPEERKQLHCAMTRYISDTIAKANLCALQVWVDGDPDELFIADLCGRFDLQCHAQQGEDLGARIYNAAKQTLKNFTGVVFIGSDCPFIEPDYLHRALVELQNQDAVVGPASDGGYVLLGLRRLSSALFNNIAWGTGEVLAATEARLLELDWSYTLLPLLPDIDRPDDLGLLAQGKLPATLRRFAP
ncbi:MAG: TIGR04282 family arsenosugar biosynthesis glycosyltransferase [Cellvibrionaceae bacterium]